MRDGGPGGALERLRRKAEAREAKSHDALYEAALEAAGEVGWRHVSVELIITRAEISRARFYRLFKDKDACLAEAHRVIANRLVDEILGEFSRTPDPRAGLRRALTRVAVLTEERPLLARGLLNEARLGDGTVSVTRAEVCERLSRVATDACREIPGSRHSPPPTKAIFILTALDTAILEATTKTAHTPLSAQLDTLVEIACLPCR